MKPNQAPPADARPADARPAGAPPADAQLAKACHGLLHGLLDRCPGVQWAAVSTAQGLHVAQAGAGDQDALAAMAAALHALSDGLATEASLGLCQDVLLNAAGGRMAVLPAPGAGLVLAATGASSLPPGMLLAACAAARTELARLGAPALAMAG